MEFNDFQANYEKIKAMLEKNKKKEKMSKEEISKIRKEQWTDEKKEAQSKIAKLRWAMGDLNHDLIYHKDYYTTQYKLIDIETGETIIYNGSPACYTALGYASNGGMTKQPEWPNRVHNRSRSKIYKVEIIKNKGDLK